MYFDMQKPNPAMRNVLHSDMQDAYCKKFLHFAEKFPLILLAGFEFGPVEYS